MDNRKSHSVICPFCGKERTYQTWEVEHCWNCVGKERPPEFKDNDSGCDCELGKIAHKNKAYIKPMCMNCKYYTNCYCTNKKEISEISDMFEVGNKIYVKKPEKKCKHYELGLEIFKYLINE